MLVSVWSSNKAGKHKPFFEVTGEPLMLGSWSFSTAMSERTVSNGLWTVGNILHGGYMWDADGRREWPYWAGPHKRRLGRRRRAAIRSYIELLELLQVKPSRDQMVGRARRFRVFPNCGAAGAEDVMQVFPVGVMSLTRAAAQKTHSRNAKHIISNRPSPRSQVYRSVIILKATRPRCC